MTTYQCIVLAARPQGVVASENFRLETRPVPAIKEGEVLVRNHAYAYGRFEKLCSSASTR